MPVVSEMVHPAGFSFTEQRSIALLRDVSGLVWKDIAKRVKNLKGERPRPRHVANYYRKLSKRSGKVIGKYKNCGSKPTKVNEDVERFLVSELKTQRKDGPCTASTLQVALAKEKGVTITAAYVRKILRKRGYKWLPRRQKKQQYTKEVMAERLAFAKKVVSLSGKALGDKMAMAMDGVVLCIPPKDPTERLNFCRADEEYMWRKPTEAFDPKLAGADDSAKQVPLHRAVPLWGGCSYGGFAPIVFHKRKKLTCEEWSAAVTSGKLTQAIKALKPAKAAGPWEVICDNEGFLRAASSNRAHKKCKVKLWKIPAKSPDLNPIERFWGWLRKKLRSLDLKDAVAKKPTLGKAAYISRVRRLVKTKAAQTVAANCAKSLRKVCREVVQKKGAASSG